MAIQLSDEVKELLQDKDTLKVLATTGEDGVPHVVIKGTLHVGEDGNLVYLELLESSRTNKNLVRSIWFDRKVAVALQGKGGESYQIIGKPVKALITGPVFQKHYVSIRERLGDVDLATVWIIEPEKVTDQRYSARRREEETLHPTFIHLDRLAKRA
jgi:general stress protein 26